MMKLLDPKSDVTFKKIFGEHKKILMAFLNAILNLPEPIVDVFYLSNELHSDVEKGKGTIVDIRCIDDRGRQFIVEMQMVYFPSFLQRAMFNMAKLTSRQLESGQDFNTLKPSYSINILVKSAFPNIKDYKNSFKITNTKNIEHSIGDVEFIFIELEKWKNLAKFDEKNLLDHWLKYFMDPDFYKKLSKEDIEKYGFVVDATKFLELSSYSREELDAHDRQLDMMRTHNAIMRGAMEQGLKEGFEKGIEQGIEQGIEKGIEKGEQIAFEKLISLLQDIKLNNFSNEELISKYKVNLNYIEQLRSTTA